MSDRFEDLLVELEYLRIRRLELAEERRAHEQVLGEPITPELVERLRQVFLKTLRRCGNEALAARHVAAHIQHEKALATVLRLCEEGATTAAIEAAGAARDEAMEDLERLIAEADAFLASLEPGDAGGRP
jgi:hypothetical protein